MNKLISAKNRKVEFPKRIKLTEPDTLNNYIYDLEFDSGLITEPGTNIDVVLINLLQKNTISDLKCEKAEATEVNSNLKIEIYGLNADIMVSSTRLLFTGFNIAIPNILQDQTAFIPAVVKRNDNSLILSGARHK
ncbi:MAG: hypothetical protein LBV03_07705 [Fusobacteriales bacterium]|jgi:hypothetical protein|nr:hypothetical protein [Fusobacteriales bacterium]